MVGELEEDLLHAFLLLSIFSAAFSTLAAAEVLGLAGAMYCCSRRNAFAAGAVNMWYIQVLIAGLWVSAMALV